MKRFIADRLLAWKTSDRRKPLILRGARQVGKTYSVEAFGREQFEQVLTVDLEKNPGLHDVFARDLDPIRIVSEL